MSRKIEVTAEKLCEGQSWIKYFKYQDTEYRILISGGDGKYSDVFNPKRSGHSITLYPDKANTRYDLVVVAIDCGTPFPSDGQKHRFTITVSELVDFGPLEDE